MARSTRPDLTRLGCWLGCWLAALVSCTGPAAPDPPEPPTPIRIATFNTSLHRSRPGQLAAELAAGCEPARSIAAILRDLRADIVVLQEFDFDADRRALTIFRDDYLAAADLVTQPATEPISYDHAFADPVNTGEPSGFDLDTDGRSDGPGDAWGFGRHPGEYGMAVLSRWPIDHAAVRTFRKLRWAAMPDHLMPTGYWPPEVAAELRLSSKSHQDVPIRLPDGRTLHLLISHPTPPAFDGPERRNRRRNHDEIRLWAEYLDDADWLVDDQGGRGGLARAAWFVICGDQNADPEDGESLPGAIQMLLEHPRVATDRAPASRGGVEAAARQGGANAGHSGDPAHDTADFPDTPGPGNLRVDYLLPAAGLTVTDRGLFWPTRDDPRHAWLRATDHRPVWIDIR